MTEEKVSKLKVTFPDVEESSLLEILLSCNGSLSNAESILYESFPGAKRRKIIDHSVKQSNINKLLGVEDVAAFTSTNTKNSNRPVYLYTKEDVERTVPYASIHYDFLPKDLSENLLKFLVKDTEGFAPQEFYLFGNKCVSNHTNKIYSSKKGQELYYNGHLYASKCEYTDDMKMTQLLIEDQVSKELKERPKLPFQTDEKWKGDLVLCNRFEAKNNNLDWHSDRMTYIGPHPIIASFSIGATRDFRIKKEYNDSGSKFNTIYAVPLPHNTLLIMHAGFQEEYKHCVSSTTEFSPHAISGTTRFNLTYRNYLKRFQDNLPMCSKCGAQMDLKRSFKDPKTRGRYVWICASSYLNKECNGFHYADFNEECLYTDNVEKCSRWISRDDKMALKCFRESLVGMEK